MMTTKGEIEEERQDQGRPRARRKRARTVRLGDASEWNKVMCAPQLMKAAKPRRVKEEDKEGERRILTHHPPTKATTSPRARIPKNASKGLGCPKCRRSSNGCNRCGRYPERSSLPKKRKRKETKEEAPCPAPGNHHSKKKKKNQTKRKGRAEPPIVIEDEIEMERGRPQRRGKKGVPTAREKVTEEEAPQRDTITKRPSRGGGAAGTSTSPSPSKEDEDGGGGGNNNTSAPWTPAEDRDLLKLVDIHGSKRWSHIAQLTNGRTGKQCRERWLNHLRPNIKKDEWSAEEERILAEGHAKLGTKWSSLAKLLPGRTENSIKNHWNATLRRKGRKKNNCVLKEYTDTLQSTGLTPEEDRVAEIALSSALAKETPTRTSEGKEEDQDQGGRPQRRGKGRAPTRLCDESEWEKVMEAPQLRTTKSSSKPKAVKGVAAKASEKEEAAFEPKIGVWWKTESGGNFFYGVVIDQKQDSYKIMYEDGDVSWHTLCKEKLDLSKCFPKFLPRNEKMTFISKANMSDLPIRPRRVSRSLKDFRVSTAKSRSIAAIIRKDDPKEANDKGDSKTQRHEGGEPSRCETCADCFTTTTPVWRKDKDTGEVLCNACGIYKSTHGVRRNKMDTSKKKTREPVAVVPRIEPRSLPIAAAADPCAKKFQGIRSYAQNLGLNTPCAWRKLHDSDKLTKGMPRDPDVAFVDSWISWCDFLGSKKWQSFYLAKDFASGLGIQCKDEWRAYCSSIKMPLTIPHNPDIVYSSDWRGWEDFLGIQVDLTDEQVEEMFLNGHRCPVCKVSKKGTCGAENSSLRCCRRQASDLPFEPLSKARKKFYAILSMRPLGSKYERDKLWEKVHAETEEEAPVVARDARTNNRPKSKTKTAVSGGREVGRGLHTAKGPPNARALAQAKSNEVQPNKQQHLPKSDSESESEYESESESESESFLSEMATAAPVLRDNKLQPADNGNSRNEHPALAGVGELEDLVRFYMEADGEGSKGRREQGGRNPGANLNVGKGGLCCDRLIPDRRLSRPSSKPSSRLKALGVEDISRIVSREMERSRKAADLRTSGLQNFMSPVAHPLGAAGSFSMPPPMHMPMRMPKGFASYPIGRPVKNHNQNVL
jgi:hypothetical protein